MLAGKGENIGYILSVINNMDSMNKFKSQDIVAFRHFELSLQSTLEKVDTDSFKLKYGVTFSKCFSTFQHNLKLIVLKRFWCHYLMLQLERLSQNKRLNIA